MNLPAPGSDAAARRRWREVDGIVLLDKPAGTSSNHALQRARRLLRAAKGGHAGTLDPMATGMLPLCFGQATKACGSLLGASKAYRATLRLGAATDSGDADGTVTRECPVPPLDPTRVAAVAGSLVGRREQQPPMYSALKHGGRPLYELARAGVEVERASRTIDILELRTLRLDDREVEFEVRCSKGTYVRVLGEELAAGLGTCGHLVALRRLWVEPFGDRPMVSLEAIERWAGEGEPPADRPDWLLPVETAFVGRPRLDLDATAALHLTQGRILAAPAAVAPGPAVCAYGPDGRFLGLVTVGEDRRVRVERLFVEGAGSGVGRAGP